MADCQGHIHPPTLQQTPLALTFVSRRYSSFWSLANIQHMVSLLNLKSALRWRKCNHINRSHILLCSATALLHPAYRKHTIDEEDNFPLLPGHKIGNSYLVDTNPMSRVLPTEVGKKHLMQNIIPLPFEVTLRENFSATLDTWMPQEPRAWEDL